MKIPRAIHVAIVLAIAAVAGAHQIAGAQDQEFFEGDYDDAAIIGNSLPSTWRPFSSDSPWNTPISADAGAYADNDQIMQTIKAAAGNIRLSNSYIPPVWVVNADNMPFHYADSPYPYDIWDTNYDGLTEAGVPIDETMWGENTPDGHITIIDPFRKMSWEMSRFTGIINGVINCSTFNVWDVTGSGVGDPNEGNRWKARGGRGSGFPVIAGLIRPEELEAGLISHALIFTFPTNRDDWFMYPATRTDGDYVGDQYPMAGMKLQLDPNLTEADFDAWGLTREVKVIARALQTYGMYNGDQGGAMAIQIQLLDPDPNVHADLLDDMFPGFRQSIRNIPISHFRIVDEGIEATHEASDAGAGSTTVSPLILPQGGLIAKDDQITISSATSSVDIRYTLDGSTPTESSTSYTGPFSIPHGATLLARAFRSDKDPSPVTRAEFWLSTSDIRPMPPQLSID